MKFLPDLENKVFGCNTRNVNLLQDFESIERHDDVKNMIRRALDSEESFNLFLWEEPTSSKTLFLLELAKQKGANFFDCTNKTRRILDVLEHEWPKIILLDKLYGLALTSLAKIWGGININVVTNVTTAR